MLCDSVSILKNTVLVFNQLFLFYTMTVFLKLHKKTTQNVALQYYDILNCNLFIIIHLFKFLPIHSPRMVDFLCLSL